MPRIKATAILLSLATLSVPAFAQGSDPAVRDSSLSALNYVQGQVTLDGQPVTTTPNSAPRRLHAGDTLAITSGSADVMLAPGSLLRLGAGAQVSLVASDGHRAEVRIEGGRANVAVNMVQPQSLLLVDLPNGQTQLLERGLYTFDASSETVKVFNGEAEVFPGRNTESNVKPVKVKDEREVVLSDARVKPVAFDRMQDQGELLPWTGPQEAHADGDYGMAANTARSGDTFAGDGVATAGYGYGPGLYGFGEGYPGYAYGGWGYPYAFYGYPYGFLGFAGFGYSGFGYSGFGYGGFGYGGIHRIGHGYGHDSGYRGGYSGGVRGGGFSGSRGFGGGGFHGGGGGGRR